VLLRRLEDDFGFPVRLEYEDEDGDGILLASQNDLREMVDHHSDVGRSAAYVTVSRAPERAEGAVLRPIGLRVSPGAAGDGGGVASEAGDEDGTGEYDGGFGGEADGMGGSVDADDDAACRGRAAERRGRRGLVSDLLGDSGGGGASLRHGRAAVLADGLRGADGFASPMVGGRVARHAGPSPMAGARWPRDLTGSHRLGDDDEDDEGGSDARGASWLGGASGGTAGRGADGGRDAGGSLSRGPGPLESYAGGGTAGGGGDVVVVAGQGALRQAGAAESVSRARTVSADGGTALGTRAHATPERSPAPRRPRPPLAAAEPGRIRWRRGERLGSGAVGTVFQGLNLDTGELMAVKLMDSADLSARELAALEQEVQLLRSFRHPNIVRYLGAQREGSTLCIFLEYVPGGSVKRLLDRFGGLEEAVVRRYTRHLLVGLEYLHRNGIAHRDVKGGNSLVGLDGVIKLADFGASKRVPAAGALPGASRTGTGVKGTPQWMAPEVVREQEGETGWRRADIWSVGCTVIEMATGHPPWSQFPSPVTAMYHIATTDSPPDFPRGLSPHGTDFLTQCLRLDPRLRPDVSALLLHPFVADASAVVHRGLAPPGSSAHGGHPGGPHPHHAHHHPSDGRFHHAGSSHFGGSPLGRAHLPVRPSTGQPGTRSSASAHGMHLVPPTADQAGSIFGVPFPAGRPDSELSGAGSRVNTAGGSATPAYDPGLGTERSAPSTPGRGAAAPLKADGGASDPAPRPTTATMAALPVLDGFMDLDLGAQTPRGGGAALSGRAPAGPGQEWRSAAGRSAPSGPAPPLLPARPESREAAGRPDARRGGAGGAGDEASEHALLAASHRLRRAASPVSSPAKGANPAFLRRPAPPVTQPGSPGARAAGAQPSPASARGNGSRLQPLSATPILPGSHGGPGLGSGVVGLGVPGLSSVGDGDASMALPGARYGSKAPKRAAQGGGGKGAKVPSAKARAAGIAGVSGVGIGAQAAVGRAPSVGSGLEVEEERGLGALLGQDGRVVGGTATAGSVATALSAGAYTVLSGQGPRGTALSARASSLGETATSSATSPGAERVPELLAGSDEDEDDEEEGGGEEGAGPGFRPHRRGAVGTGGGGEDDEGRSGADDDDDDDYSDYHEDWESHADPDTPTRRVGSFPGGARSPAAPAARRRPGSEAGGAAAGDEHAGRITAGPGGRGAGGNGGPSPSSRLLRRRGRRPQSSQDSASGRPTAVRLPPTRGALVSAHRGVGHRGTVNALCILRLPLPQATPAVPAWPLSRVGHDDVAALLRATWLGDAPARYVPFVATVGMDGNAMVQSALSLRWLDPSAPGDPSGVCVTLRHTSERAGTGTGGAAGGGSNPLLGAVGRSASTRRGRPPQRGHAAAGSDAASTSAGGAAAPGAAAQSVAPPLITRRSKSRAGTTGQQRQAEPGAEPDAGSLALVTCLASLSGGSATSLYALPSPDPRAGRRSDPLASLRGLVATGTDEGSVWVWDVHGPLLQATAAAVASAAGRGAPAGPGPVLRAPLRRIAAHKSAVRCIAVFVDPDHKREAAAAAAARAADASAHPDGAAAAAAAADEDAVPTGVGMSGPAAWRRAHGLRVVTGAQDGTIRVLSPSARRASRSLLRGHSGPVMSLVVLQSGKQLLSSSADKTVRLWDLASGVQRAVYSEHLGAVHQALVVPVAARPLFSEAAGTGKADDAVAGAASLPTSAAASHGPASASSGLVPRIEHCFAGQAPPARPPQSHDDDDDDEAGPLFEHPGTAGGAADAGAPGAEAPDDGAVPSSGVAAAARQSGPAGSPVPRPGQPARGGHDPRGGAPLALLPCMVSSSRDKSVKVWAATGSCLFSLREHQGTVSGIALPPVPSGPTLPEQPEGQPVRGRRPAVGVAAFADARAASGGGSLVTVSTDGVARLWDLGSGRLVRSLRGHRGTISCVAWGAAGQAATAGSDGVLRLWDLGSGTVAHAFPAGRASSGQAAGPAVGSAVETPPIPGAADDEPDAAPEGRGGATAWINQLAWEGEVLCCSTKSGSVWILGWGSEEG